jgi:uncharacterized membrane protein
MSKTRLDKKRHILKAITWRIVGTLDTLLLGWVISGSFKVGAAIGGAEIITKMILYYMHERIWYRLPFGVSRQDAK